MCSRKITHSSPSSSGSLAQAFHNLPQRSKSVSPIAYPSVMSRSTVWWQGSASQLEVLFMIGCLYLLQRQLIRPAQVKRGSRVADAACFFEPLERLAEILGDAPTVLINFGHPSRIYHGFGLDVLA